MSDSTTRTRKVTSFDVARHAGVSRAAVSRAFTPDASVSPETREKVHRAAKELGYRVNYLARSLINQRSDLVGIVVAGLDNPFRTMQIEQLTRALIKRNFRPVLLPTGAGADASDLIGQLLHYSVSGVIVTSDAPPTSLCEECADYGVPIVLINKGDDIPLVDRVVNDDKSAGQIAANVLIEGGGRRPAVMVARAVSYTARRRSDAFLARCRALGVEAEIIDIAINDYASGYEAAMRLADTGIDALFCVNDYLACGVIDRIGRERALRSRSIRIIGHDDIPQAGWAGYNLTTILQPCDLQATQAIDLLVSRMEEPRLTARVAFTPVTLVKRGTA
ncbi:MAG TPA: substrate-binding domain-containing protein [Alphaproteobacteria bacterium]|nr:substrate-binding domain-containing protein [Alphaproteobacteria bacterium]